jgi:myo-inositol-1(or 4)-monophosphatase|tara:strand:- start:999 stop:1787 length:789 start_codon:yes stop_codon:yes gene_type:complete
MQIQPPIINIFEKASRKAGRILTRDFGEIENLQIKSKGVGNFVTNTDLKVESIILETLQYYFPDVTYISEEKGKIKGNKDIIIIDPIDGTTNLIHGIPFLGIVISKITNGIITDGIIFNPIMNEFFWASKGKGAWCNDKRLRVSQRQNLEDCVIATGGYQIDRIYPNYLNELNNISEKCAGIRNMGSAALNLAYLASGKIDGYWEKNLNLWDVSSGVLLVNEAGGKISETEGANWEISSRNILATNSLIHDKLQDKLQDKIS